MSRRVAVGVGVAVALLVLAGGGVFAYQFFVPQKATSGTSTFALSTPTPATPASAGALDGRWTVAAGSEVGYRAREKFVEQSSPNDAVARTSSVTGEMTLASQSSQVVAGGLTVTADLSKLKSTDANAVRGGFNRDNFVGGNILETGRFRDAVYAADPVTIPAVIAGGGQQLATHGRMTIHGTTKEVDIPVVAQLSGERIEVIGSFSLVMTDYGVPVPDVGFTKVEPQVTLELHLFFQRG
ncbi:MAG: hypothetical protein QOE92_1829 [Chloroflexota bacterium]|nr:hypothetical protein [Chloroflexota bacterium]